MNILGEYFLNKNYIQLEPINGEIYFLYYKYTYVGLYFYDFTDRYKVDFSVKNIRVTEMLIPLIDDQNSINDIFCWEEAKTHVNNKNNYKFSYKERKNIEKQYRLKAFL